MVLFDLFLTSGGLFTQPRAWLDDFGDHEFMNAANTVPFGDTRNVMYGSVGMFEPVTITRSTFPPVEAGAVLDGTGVVLVGGGRGTVSYVTAISRPIR